jgi:hypothetical protein
MLAVAALLVVPATALARTKRVVPFKTVAGVPLKLTPTQVRHRLGRPSHTVRVGGKVAEYDYNKLALSVQFDTLHHPVRSNFVGVAVGSATPNIRYHTVHGIHIGSSRAAVRRAFGHKCHWSLGNCTMWKGRPGALNSTSFALVFFQGKVTAMNNQYVFKDF